MQTERAVDHTRIMNATSFLAKHNSIIPFETPQNKSFTNSINKQTADKASYRTLDRWYKLEFKNENRIDMEERYPVLQLFLT